MSKIEVTIFKVTEIAAQEGFYPDLISTDLHSLSVNGPAYNLVTVMSKFLYLGMNLYDVVKAVTSQAAAVVGWDDQIGSLSKGKIADITILRLEKGEFLLEDCKDSYRTCKEFLQPVAVWKNGVAFPVKVCPVKDATNAAS